MFVTYVHVVSAKMKTTSIIVIVSVLLSTCTVQSARILGIFPMPGKSHYFLGCALMRALAEEGHDVTVISPFGEENPPKGGSYRDIKLTKMLEVFEDRRKDMNMFEMGDMNPFLNLPFVAFMISDLSEWTLQDESLQKFINSGETFDIVIVEQFFDDALKALATHFKGNLVVFNSIGANFWVNSLVGNPSPLSYIPDTFLSYPPEMTFCERLTNTMIYVLNQAIHYFYLYPKYNRVIQKYIPNGPNVHDVLFNASLVLLNSHPSLNQPIPHVPNMIEIGGFHIKPPKKLPDDLQQFLDNAKDGVIYFSMGSNLRSADLPPEKLDAILKSLSKLKQKVLWKWEEDELPGQPENIRLGKWLPQHAILAHPNVRLFITHGGLLSTTETIYFGVPVLAIPIYGDQKLNAQLAVTNGFGLSLPFRELCEETLTQKLNELITNPKYTINAKTKSKIFHDRQVSPMETALYWIDYVIRHKGAPHLQVAALDLPWYKYHVLDVIAFLALVTLAGTIVTCIIFKKIFQKVCSRVCSTKKQQKLKKN